VRSVAQVDATCMSERGQYLDRLPTHAPRAAGRPSGTARITVDTLAAMDDGSVAATSPLVLLTYAIDEINECLELVNVARPKDQRPRKWWQSSFLRTSADVVADQRLLYIDENVDRAAVRWREAVTFIAQLQSAHAGNMLVTGLIDELTAAGMQQMASRLQRRQLPRLTDDLLAYLASLTQDLNGYRAMLQRTQQKLRTQPGGAVS
jgi:hypothetical protein